MFELWPGPAQRAGLSSGGSGRLSGGLSGGVAGMEDKDTQLARPASSSDCVSRSVLLYPAGFHCPVVLLLNLLPINIDEKVNPVKNEYKINDNLAVVTLIF